MGGRGLSQSRSLGIKVSLPPGTMASTDPNYQHHGFETISSEISSTRESEIGDDLAPEPVTPVLHSPPDFFSSAGAASSSLSSSSSWSSSDHSRLPRYMSPTLSLPRSLSVSHSPSGSPGPITSQSDNNVVVDNVNPEKKGVGSGNNNNNNNNNNNKSVGSGDGGASCVPFVWEEAPGKSAISAWRQLPLFPDADPPPSHSLKLPPKLALAAQEKPKPNPSRMQIPSSSLLVVRKQRRCVSWKLPTSDRLARLRKSMSAGSASRIGTSSSAAVAAARRSLRLLGHGPSVKPAVPGHRPGVKPAVRGPDDDGSILDDDDDDDDDGEMKCIPVHHKLLHLCKSLFQSAWSSSSHFLLHHHHHHHHHRTEPSATEPSATEPASSSVPNQRFFFEHTGPRLLGSSSSQPTEEKLSAARVDAWLDSVDLLRLRRNDRLLLFSEPSAPFPSAIASAGAEPPPPPPSPDAWKCSIKFDESQPPSPKAMPACSSSELEGKALAMDDAPGVRRNRRDPDADGGRSEDDDDGGGDDDVVDDDNDSDGGQLDGGRSGQGQEAMGASSVMTSATSKLGGSNSHTDDGDGGGGGDDDGDGDADADGDGDGDGDVGVGVDADGGGDGDMSVIRKEEARMSILSLVKLRNRFGRMIKLTSPRTAPKPKQSASTSVEAVAAYPSASSSSSPWILDLGPSRGSKPPPLMAGGHKKPANPLPHHMLNAAHFVRIKDIVVRKVSLTANNNKKAANSGGADIWSPSLATYLYNQQKEARDLADDGDGGESAVVSIRSGSVSFRLHLDRIPLSSTRNGSSPFNIDLW